MEAVLTGRLGGFASVRVTYRRRCARPRGSGARTRWWAPGARRPGEVPRVPAGVRFYLLGVQQRRVA